MNFIYFMKKVTLVIDATTVALTKLLKVDLMHIERLFHGQIFQIFAAEQVSFFSSQSIEPSTHES